MSNTLTSKHLDDCCDQMVDGLILNTHLLFKYIESMLNAKKISVEDAARASNTLASCFETLTQVIEEELRVNNNRRTKQSARKHKTKARPNKKVVARKHPRSAAPKQTGGAR